MPTNEDVAVVAPEPPKAGESPERKKDPPSHEPARRDPSAEQPGPYAPPLQPSIDPPARTPPERHRILELVCASADGATPPSRRCVMTASPYEGALPDHSFSARASHTAGSRSRSRCR